MTSLQYLSDDAVLKALGERLARRRLDNDYTQKQLAERAGTGRRAVQRLESGDPVTTVAFIRVLRALDALAELDAGIPKVGPSPLQVLAGEGRVRRRASGQSAKAPAPPGEFRWGQS